jgi:hypothetical protein
MLFVMEVATRRLHILVVSLYPDTPVNAQFRERILVLKCHRART